MCSYKLQPEKNRFCRVPEGCTQAALAQFLCAPFCGEVHAGAVVTVSQGEFFAYSARVGDDYASLASKFGVEEALLKRANAGRVIYPTCTVYIPSPLQKP